MQRACSVCGGTGVEEQVDLSLPPPPCRVCRPAEAEQHQELARATLTVDAAHRLAVYLALKHAGVLAASPRA